MSGPFVAARVEEWSEFAGIGGESTNVGSFMAVVVKTGKGQVPGQGSSAVFSGDDVIDLEGGLVVHLRNQAVFATASRPFPHQSHQVGIHERLRSISLFVLPP